jgi:hypothetical protein
MESKLFLTPCEALKLGPRLSNPSRWRTQVLHSLPKESNLLIRCKSQLLVLAMLAHLQSNHLQPIYRTVLHQSPICCLNCKPLRSQHPVPILPKAACSTHLPLLATIRTPHLRQTHLPVIPPLLNWMCAPSHSNSLWHIYLALERIQMS